MHDETAGLWTLLRIPTLIACGDHDLLTPDEYSRKMAASLPQSELVIVPGASHLALLDKPDAINDGLVRLVKRATPSRTVALRVQRCGNGCGAWLTHGAGTATLERVEDTVALGSRLGEQLRAGDVVVLSGPLGAGKTVLAKGIAAAMDVDGPVTSPSYVLARVHPPRRPGAPAMIHVDMYRLLDHDGADLLGELDSLDLDTELDDAVVVVEWGEGLAERLAERHLDIRLERLSRLRRADRDVGVEPLMSLVLALDTATPAVTAGIVRRDDMRRAGRAGHRRRPGARRTAHAERAGRPRRCRADDGRPRRRRGGLWPRPVHRPAGRDGDRRRLRARAGHPGARGVQPGRHRGADHRRRRWWSPTPAGARSTGRATATGSAPTARPSTPRPTSIPAPRRRWPARRSTRRCSACRCAGRVYPTPAGLVAAVADWSQRRRRWWRCICAGRTPSRWRRAMTARSEPVTIGALTPADAERCAELEAQLFDGDDPWPAAAFNRELASPHNHYVAARAGGTLIGYAGISRLGRTAAVRVRGPHHRRGHRPTRGGASAAGCSTSC